MFKNNESKIDEYRRELERQQERKLRMAADSESYVWGFPTMRKRIHGSNPTKTGWVQDQEMAKD